MRPKKSGEDKPTGADGSLETPEEEPPVELPDGFAFAGGSEEEEEASLEDLEAEGAEEEGSDEQEEEEPESDELTPEEVRALRAQLSDSQAQIGRMGDEMGQLREQAQRGPSRQPGIAPVEGGGQPAADPYEQALVRATEEFIRTGDAVAYAKAQSQITNAKILQGGHYFREQIVSETRAEADFFAKNHDLLEGTPRSIYQGQLAQVQLLNPRAPASEQRTQAAESTRGLLKDLNWSLVDADKAARREADKLRGPAGRRSRTGRGATAEGGMAAVQQSTRTAIADHRARQKLARTRE